MPQIPPKPKEPKEPTEPKEPQVWSTSISKSNTNYRLLELLCLESKYLYNSTLFMYRQQNHLNTYLYKCVEQEIQPDLDSLDPNKANIPFLKLISRNGFNFESSFKSMPKYFKALLEKGLPSFKQNYDRLPALASNCTIKLVDKNIKSYEALKKKYFQLPQEQRNKPGNYRPGFPKYKAKNELQIFQIYAINIERISKTEAKVIWPERIQAIITENNLTNTDLIIQVPSDLDYEIETITKSIGESCLRKNCKYSLLRVVPKQNAFKVELVYDRATDISNLENLHELRDQEYQANQATLDLAIEIQKGLIGKQLKQLKETEQEPQINQLIKQELATVNKLNKTSLTKTYDYLNTKRTKLNQPKAKSKEIRMKTLPTYTKDLDRQQFISKATIFAGLDLGINNFCSLAILADTKESTINALKTLGLFNVKIPAKLFNGQPIKSKLKHLHYQLEEAQSKLQQFDPDQYTSNKIKNIYQKRDNILDDLIKQAAAEILKHCLRYNVQVLIVGYNKEWKQSPKLHKDTKKLFEIIPFKQFINYITFKLEPKGILVTTTEESYTSQTSVLDFEQPTQEFGNPKRRKKRGLFITTDRLRINADINAAYQMIKKIQPDINYTKSLIDTKGSFFSTFSKQHKTKISHDTLRQHPIIIGTTRFYTTGNKIKQTQIPTAKQKRFRQNCTRTFTLYLSQVKSDNKVA